MVHQRVDVAVGALDALTDARIIPALVRRLHVEVQEAIERARALLGPRGDIARFAGAFEQNIEAAVARVLAAAPDDSVRDGARPRCIANA